jgi:hypothetical protein
MGMTIYHEAYIQRRQSKPSAQVQVTSDGFGVELLLRNTEADNAPCVSVRLHEDETAALAEGLMDALLRCGVTSMKRNRLLRGMMIKPKRD